MNIESTKITVHKSAEELYTLLTDIKNFEKLMPDNISKFEVLSDKRFLFALKGMPEIVLELKESTPHSKVVLGAASDKLPFTLTANLDALGEQTDAQLQFEGSFNPMMAMMVKGPITNFIGTLVEKMKNL